MNRRFVMMKQISHDFVCKAGCFANALRASANITKAARQCRVFPKIAENPISAVIVMRLLAIGFTS